MFASLKGNLFYFFPSPFLEIRDTFLLISTIQVSLKDIMRVSISLNIAYKHMLYIGKRAEEHLSLEAAKGFLLS